MLPEYDYTFRQLMSEYPDRSWAKTYLQGWNLIMRDVLSKDFPSSNNQKYFNKDNICWPFNKGKCSDLSCVKEHRCGYCGKWGHGQHICRKRKRAGHHEGNDGKNNKPTGGQGAANNC